MSGQRRYIWGVSGSGLSDYAWQLAESTGAAWVGNDAAAHITMLRTTVEQELAFGMEQQAYPVDIMHRRIANAASQWGLTDLLQRDPTALSTGQTRRVAIASALLTAPSALVLDCPLDGCDSAATDTLATVIRDFPGDVTICDRRWSPLADECECFELQASGELIAAEPPHPTLAPGAYVDLASARAGMITISSLTVDRGDFTLGPLSATFPAGAITHLRGANGCGKTSLMLAMAGLIPSVGEITAPVIGWAPTAMDQAFSQSTVRKEVSLGSDRAHGDAALQWCGLAAHADQHPLDLSSSQRRLLAFACAIVRGPGAIFLDEPTVGLDTVGIETLADLMRHFVEGQWHEYLSSHGLTTQASGDPTGDRVRPAILWSCHETDFAAISDYVLQLPHLPGMGPGTKPGAE